MHGKLLVLLSKKIIMSTGTKNKTSPAAFGGNEVKKEPTGKDKKNRNNTGHGKGSTRKNVSRHPTTEPNPEG